MSWKDFVQGWPDAFNSIGQSAEEQRRWRQCFDQTWNQIRQETGGDPLDFLGLERVANDLRKVFGDGINASGVSSGPRLRR